MRASAVEGASTVEDEAEGVSVGAFCVSLSSSAGSSIDASAAAAKKRQNIVTLNVGGKKFTTTLTTLTKTPNSMLAAMFSGRFAVTTDEKNRFFIDRDGKHFGTILNYLRDGFVVVPDTPQAKNEVKSFYLCYCVLNCVLIVSSCFSCCFGFSCFFFVLTVKVAVNRGAILSTFWLDRFSDTGRTRSGGQLEMESWLKICVRACFFVWLSLFKDLCKDILP
jgi:hypothetical protein